MTIEIRKLRDGDYSPVSRFIAALNGTDENHITDLGDDPYEIENFIKTDLLDVKATEGFLLALDNDRLVGIMGADVDLSKKVAYLLGPFVEYCDWPGVTSMLWEKLQSILPDGIDTFMLSPDVKNAKCREFAEKHDFQVRVEAGIFKLIHDNVIMQAFDGIGELTPPDHKKFCDLHDLLFPDTYYGGKDIIGRCNEDRKVFVDAEITGYIYIESQPDFNIANIEFTGVAPEARGKGLAHRLLAKAVDWAFNERSVNEITLSVKTDNPAVNIYKKFGFVIDYEVIGYHRHLKSQ